MDMQTLWLGFEKYLQKTWGLGNHIQACGKPLTMVVSLIKITLWLNYFLEKEMEACLVTIYVLPIELG